MPRRAACVCTGCHDAASDPHVWRDLSVRAGASLTHAAFFSLCAKAGSRLSLVVLVGCPSLTDAGLVPALAGAQPTLEEARLLYTA